MKLTIGIVIASILIIGLTDFSDATFLPLPPAPCEPPKPPGKPPKPGGKPPKPPAKPPVKPPKNPKPPANPPKPPVQPPKPCNPPPCGPGGVACQGCPGRDNLCQELISLIREIDAKIRKCVCGQKYI